eukprot:364428-Chlamydomonas_euryale.AAC.5
MMIRSHSACMSARPLIHGSQAVMIQHRGAEHARRYELLARTSHCNWPSASGSNVRHPAPHPTPHPRLTTTLPIGATAMRNITGMWTLLSPSPNLPDHHRHQQNRLDHHRRRPRAFVHQVESAAGWRLAAACAAVDCSLRGGPAVVGPAVAGPAVAGPAVVGRSEEPCIRTSQFGALLRSGLPWGLCCGLDRTQTHTHTHTHIPVGSHQVEDLAIPFTEDCKGVDCKSVDCKGVEARGRDLIGCTWSWNPLNGVFSRGVCCRTRG